ncbi:hypothetical protein MYP_3460 [Sporocytophaga myxococcoides]|uniref:Lmo0937 family membrane protein n=2 Tax=Sporocytophaga myxococcoides TaxID=153721 RepID=A0A098LH04_9BACT|nr:hypothetical protein MYP_3460 [Sporocytophaga myxococcoides]
MFIKRNLRDFKIRFKEKEAIMGNLLYIIAVILLIGWLVGFLGFGDAVGGFIHILLVLAVVFFLLRVIRGA